MVRTLTAAEFAAAQELAQHKELALHMHGPGRFPILEDDGATHGPQFDRTIDSLLHGVFDERQTSDLGYDSRLVPGWAPPGLDFVSVSVAPDTFQDVMRGAPYRELTVTFDHHTPGELLPKRTTVKVRMCEADKFPPEMLGGAKVLFDPRYGVGDTPPGVPLVAFVNDTRLVRASFAPYREEAAAILTADTADYLQPQDVTITVIEVLPVGGSHVRAPTGVKIKMWLTHPTAPDPTSPDVYNRVELPSRRLWPLRIEVRGTREEPVLRPIFAADETLPRDERHADERAVRWQHASLTDHLAGTLVRRPGAHGPTSPRAHTHTTQCGACRHAPTHHPTTHTTRAARRWWGMLAHRRCSGRRGIHESLWSHPSTEKAQARRGRPQSTHAPPCRPTGGTSSPRRLRRDLARRRAMQPRYPTPRTAGDRPHGRARLRDSKGCDTRRRARSGRMPRRDLPESVLPMGAQSAHRGGRRATAAKNRGRGRRYARATTHVRGRRQRETPNHQGSWQARRNRAHVTSHHHHQSQNRG